MQKKICFITLGNLYLCPYISKYTSILRCDFDVIYWNRHGVEEDIKAQNVYVFEYQMEENKGKIPKLFGYFSFRRFVLNILKKNHYDGVILLQTSAAILIYTVLLKTYPNKYVIDIRDYTFENNKAFFLIEKRLIEKSMHTVISSPGYKNFLPTYNYILVHNNPLVHQDVVERFKQKKRLRSQIIISYIGLIRFHEQNKKIINKFKNDTRFLLRFIGKDAKELEKFCENNSIINVELIDRFPSEKTLEYYFDTDIVYNLYGNNSPLLDFALSNKLYYAARLNLPILVCPNTYMGKIIEEYGFGFIFEINDPKACDRLFEYYNSIDWDLFHANCARFQQDTEDDNRLFVDAISTFVDRI